MKSSYVWIIIIAITVLLFYHLYQSGQQCGGDYKGFPPFDLPALTLFTPGHVFGYDPATELGYSGVPNETYTSTHNVTANKKGGAPAPIHSQHNHDTATDSEMHSLNDRINTHYIPNPRTVFQKTIHGDLGRPLQNDTNGLWNANKSQADLMDDGRTKPYGHAATDTITPERNNANEMRDLYLASGLVSNLDRIESQYT